VKEDLKGSTHMTSRFLYSFGVIFLAALIAFFFVSGLARAFHISLTVEGTFFLVGSMLIGSAVSIFAANVVVGIWKERDAPTR